MQKLFETPELKGYNEFRAFGAFPMQDAYGNVREQFVSKIFLKRHVAERINWNNLTTDQFHRLLRMLNDESNCTYWFNGNVIRGSKYE